MLSSGVGSALAMSSVTFVTIHSYNMCHTHTQVPYAFFFCWVIISYCFCVGTTTPSLAFAYCTRSRLAFSPLKKYRHYPLCLASSFPSYKGATDYCSCLDNRSYSSRLLFVVKSKIDVASELIRHCHLLE